jgi:hypothetical protein
MAAIMPGCRSLQVTHPGRLLEPHTHRTPRCSTTRRTWLAKTVRRSRERQIRVVVDHGWPGGARQLLREHVMSPAAPRPGVENGACWAWVQLPAHGVWIKGRPAGSLVPEVRPAPSLRGLAIADR